MVTPPTINELEQELIEQLKEIEEFDCRVLSAVDLMELGDHDLLADGTPLSVVLYEGATAYDSAINVQVDKLVNSGSAQVLTLSYQVLIVVEYKAIAEDGTAKVIATDLLDTVKLKLIGYRGKNKRPWRLRSEQQVDVNVESAAVYGQIWETTIIVYTG